MKTLFQTLIWRLCPVVCYKTGGAFEMVDPNFVVEKGDIEDAYNKIKCLFNNTVVYNFKNEDCFSKENTYSRYLALIKE